MRFSQKTEYGIRAMVALAQEYDKGLISVKQLSEREDIPTAFLEQIMADLRRTGLVTSSRGASGGYRLSNSPKITTVSQVVSALEEDLSASRCQLGCKRTVDCSARPVLEVIEKTIIETLEQISLSDLAAGGLQ